MNSAEQEPDSSARGGSREDQVDASAQSGSRHDTRDASVRDSSRHDTRDASARSGSYHGTKPLAEPKAEAWVKDSDLTLKLDEQMHRKTSLWTTLALAYGSLGVIYGDIGTSLIYVFPAIFQNVNPTTWDADQTFVDIHGAISLIFWTLTLITLVKYIGVVLAANDTGEGGTVALYALLCRTLGISPFGTMKSQDFKQVLALTSAAPTGPVRPKLGEHRFKENARAQRKEDRVQKKASPPRTPIFRKSTGFRNLLILDGTNIIRWFRRNLFAQRALLMVTMIATGLIIGDGILMPAFSVVSAISGLKRETAIDTDGEIVGISVAILVVLFFFQHIGTRKIGFLFSPVIIIWLGCNLGVGIYNLATYGGQIWAGLSPHYLVRYFNDHPTDAWMSLTGVLLCVTGTETMFAAMGHFSRGSVAIAFGLFTYPCLMISYLGQGAFLLKYPEEVPTAFWSSIPHDFYWPMLVLATMAAVVASQAAITGTFSLLRQAMALGIFPRLKIVHTGDIVEGQIFIPVINYSLMALCIAVVAGFHGDSLLLADAYGVAVISVMVITTFMIILIMLTAWETSLLYLIPFSCLFLLIEGGFLSSSLKKVPDGAWFAIVVSFFFALIMAIWWLGSLWRRRVVLSNTKANAASELFSVSRKASSAIAPDMKDETTKVAVSAAGYAVYAGADMQEDKLAMELAEALVMAQRRAPIKRVSTAGEDLLEGYKVAPVERPSGHAAAVLPILGRFSAAPAMGRSVPSAAPAPNLSRTSSGNHHLKRISGNRATTGKRESSSIQEGKMPPPTKPKESPKPSPGPPSLGKLSVSAGPPALGKISVSVGPKKQDAAVGEAAQGNVNVEMTASPRTPLRRRRASDVEVAMNAKPDRKLALLSGLGIYYSETPVGIPEVMRHFLRNVDALHEVAIFLTVRFLPMPTVKHSERLLVKAVFGLPNFYQVVARYGYQDVVDHGAPFIAQVKATILHKLEIKAGLRSKGVQDDYIHGVEDEEVEADGGHGGGRHRGPASSSVTLSHPFGLPAVSEAEMERYTAERIAHDVGVRGSKIDLTEGLPMMTRFADEAMDKLSDAAVAPGASTEAIDAYNSACMLAYALEEGVVYYLGRTWTRSAEHRNPIHSLLIGTAFRTMELLAFHDSEAWHIPLENMVELGMTVEV